MGIIHPPLKALPLQSRGKYSVKPTFECTDELDYQVKELKKKKKHTHIPFSEVYFYLAFKWH